MLRLLAFARIIFCLSISLAGCTLTTQRELFPTPVEIASISPTEAAAHIVDQGAGTFAHDPVIIKDQTSGRYYLFATGSGIPVQYSDDLKTWWLGGRVFETNPSWIRTAIPGATDLWAPDITFYQDRYVLFYLASTFGENRSAIGLATNKSLDPESPDFAWVDEGLVIASTSVSDFNAIDPNLALDAQGQPWLLYGSYWTGIKMRKLDSQTLKPSRDDRTIYSLARRTSWPFAIEAAYLLRIEADYYLFVSHDQCCEGVDSTYKIKVGRAQAITGPYVDREGKKMMLDGGTLILDSSTRWKGPGHNAILVDNDHYYLVYHAYDAEASGAPRLHIEELLWDEEGWPVAPSSILNP